MEFEFSDHLLNIEPYSPMEQKHKIRLDANESFISIPQRIVSKFQEALEKIEFNRYPDPFASTLCKSFSQYYKISPDNIVVGNGSDELIALLIGTFFDKKSKILTLHPDFSMYSFYCNLYGIENVIYNKKLDGSYSTIDIIKLINLNKISALILSNPCNPTSLGITIREIVEIIENTNAIIIIDEAYMDFWDQSILSLVPQYGNLIVLKTASKAVGFASARVGFAISNPKIACLLRTAKSPYNVNAISQTFSEILYNEVDFLKESIDKIIANTQYLLSGMNNLIFERKSSTIVNATKTNFLYVETNHADAIFQECDRNSIAIRKLDNRHLRINAGSVEENDALLTVLTSLI